MIQLKPRPETPSILTSQAVQNHIASLRNHVEHGENLQSTDFEGAFAFWRNKCVKKALFAMHSEKCCYCERYRDETREMDVEHFRPKAGVSEAPNHPGYWWLAYDWNNFFYSCKKCNQDHKKNQFPLMNEALRAYSPDDDLVREKHFLINPETENPEEFIIYDWTKLKGFFVKAIGCDDELRGDRTIKVLGLNNDTLLRRRAELVGQLQQLVETMHAVLQRGTERQVQRTAKLIKKATSSDLEFAGFRRYFFQNAGLGDYIANK